MDAQQGYIGDYKGDPAKKVEATQKMTAVSTSTECLTGLDYLAQSYQCDLFRCQMNGWENNNTFDYFWFNKEGCESNRASFQENQKCDIDCDAYDKYAQTGEDSGSNSGVDGKKNNIFNTRSTFCFLYLRFSRYYFW